MRTPAEKYLIDEIKSFLYTHREKTEEVPRILNIGSGKSLVIEEQLTERGGKFICDRVEIEDVKVSGYGIRECYQCSAESMHPVKSEEYDAAFSNYVLEHVPDINSCASEIYRVLRPGGIFVASIPNPTAPEMIIARFTPLWFHKIIASRESFETHYSFKSIRNLRRIFKRNGFNTIDVFYRSSLIDYMENLIILNSLARLYDGMINALQINRFMDNACVVFQKAE